MQTRGQQVQSEVLAILRQCGGPLSAYKVLEEMRQTTARMAPTTVYRALAALTEKGDVRRLESLNAFVACQSLQQVQSPVLSICDDCGRVDESAASEVLDALSVVTDQLGFRPACHIIELRGLCGSCTDDDDAEVSR